MKRAYQIILLFIIVSCVDPIAFDIPDGSLTLVVEGSITDQSGPYTIFVSRAPSLKQDLDARHTVSSAIVTLHSDSGDKEILVEPTRGTYQTKSTQGVVGRTYWITVVTKEGVAYESEPEKLNSAGELLSLTPQFKDDNTLVNGFEINDDRFDIVVNATGGSPTENFLRWRTTGTYGIFTFPELIDSLVLGTLVPNPAPCSGVVVSDAGELRRMGGCTCCECWVTAYDRMPFVADGALIQGNQFRNVNIGAVPITGRAFYDKYHINVEQIAHSKKAFEYFRSIRAQKEGASSLFQPPSGKLRGNIHRVGSKEEVHGYFWAGGVTSKSMFITRDMVPYRVPFTDKLIMECFNVPHATIDKPDFWQ